MVAARLPPQQPLHCLCHGDETKAEQPKVVVLLSTWLGVGGPCTDTCCCLEGRIPHAPTPCTPMGANLYLLRLSGFGQHQREKAQADLLVLGGSFTDLKEKSAVAEQMV